MLEISLIKVRIVLEISLKIIFFDLCLGSPKNRKKNLGDVLKRLTRYLRPAKAKITRGLKMISLTVNLSSDGGYGGGPDRRRGGYGINTSKYHQDTMKDTVNIP